MRNGYHKDTDQHVQIISMKLQTLITVAKCSRSCCCCCGCWCWCCWCHWCCCWTSLWTGFHTEAGISGKLLWAAFEIGAHSLAIGFNRYLPLSDFPQYWQIILTGNSYLCLAHNAWMGLISQGRQVPFCRHLQTSQKTIDDSKIHPQFIHKPPTPSDSF